MRRGVGGARAKEERLEFRVVGVRLTALGIVCLLVYLAVGWDY